jgi:hypothetical protein
MKKVNVEVFLPEFEIEPQKQRESYHRNVIYMKEEKSTGTQKGGHYGSVQESNGIARLPQLLGYVVYRHNAHILSHFARVS